jgi:hypothetical protein
VEFKGDKFGPDIILTTFATALTLALIAFSGRAGQKAANGPAFSFPAENLPFNPDPDACSDELAGFDEFSGFYAEEEYFQDAPEENPDDDNGCPPDDYPPLAEQYAAGIGYEFPPADSDLSFTDIDWDPENPHR